MPFLFLACLLNAQKAKYVFLGKEAEKRGDLYEACKIYKMGLNLLGNNAELYFNYANCLLQLNDYEEAETQFYNTLKTDTANIFPEALVGLAKMQKQNGKYKLALTTWDIIARQNSTSPTSKSYLKAQQEIKACSLILNGEIPRYSYKINNTIGLNTKDAEFASSFYDTTSLVFTTLAGVYDSKGIGQKGEFLEIRSASKQNGKWLRAGTLNENVNIPGKQTANGCFTPNRKFFYFTSCNDPSQCNLYVCSYTNGVFGKAFPIDINVPNYSTTQAMVAERENGMVIFFSSNRPGGKGGYDIWYSLVDSTFALAEPVNVAAINSDEDEISPFYFPATDELFFSSTWLPGLGGYDIFKTQSNKFSQFTPPKNIGLPYNSAANDYYFTLAGQGYKGMLSSNRVGSLSSFGKTCCNDLYEFEYPHTLLSNTPKPKNSYIQIIDSAQVYLLFDSLKNLLPIRLYFHNDEPNPKSTNNFTLLSYSDCYQDYQVVKNNYLAVNSIKGNKLFNEFVDFEYQKLQTCLRLLQQILTYGGGLDLGISGYASPLAKTKYNDILSSRRIESFLNELKNYNNGVLLKHYYSGNFGQAKLNLFKLPNGERKSKTGISDDYYKPNLSVYSLEAAKERRIELVDIQLNNLPKEQITNAKNQKTSKIDSLDYAFSSAPNDIDTNLTNNFVGLDSQEKENLNKAAVIEEENYEEVYTQSLIQLNFGEIPSGTRFEKNIKFKNTYGKNLTFDRVKCSCKCAGLVVPVQQLVPNEETTFKLVIDTRGKLGEFNGNITLTAKELGTAITINFSANITPK